MHAKGQIRAFAYSTSMELFKSTENYALLCFLETQGLGFMFNFLFEQIMKNFHFPFNPTISEVQTH